MIAQGILHSIVLVSVAFAVFAVRDYIAYKSTDNVVKVWSNKCALDVPSTYRPGPYPFSLPWCDTSLNHHDTISLMNHMRVHSADMDASVASEFGVNTRMGYLRQQGLFIINPVVQWKSSEMIVCICSIGEMTTTDNRPRAVDVQYMTTDFGVTLHRFTDKDACLIQLMVATMDVL
jgi:hypothetical protein